MNTSDILIILLVIFVVPQVFNPGIFSPFYDSIAGKLGLRDTKGPTEEFVGRRGRIVKAEAEHYVVELSGSPWKAQNLSNDYAPASGDTVIVRKVDGLTLYFEKDV